MVTDSGSNWTLCLGIDGRLWVDVLWEVGCGTGRHESLGPCQEVLIPGTTCCPGAQPRDEVMEDGDSDSRGQGVLAQ